MNSGRKVLRGINEANHQQFMQPLPKQALPSPPGALEKFSGRHSFQIQIRPFY